MVGLYLSNKERAEPPGEKQPQEIGPALAGHIGEDTTLLLAWADELIHALDHNITKAIDDLNDSNKSATIILSELGTSVESQSMEARAVMKKTSNLLSNIDSKTKRIEAEVSARPDSRKSLDKTKGKLEEFEQKVLTLMDDDMPIHLHNLNELSGRRLLAWANLYEINLTVMGETENRRELAKLMRAFHTTEVRSFIRSRERRNKPPPPPPPPKERTWRNWKNKPLPSVGTIITLPTDKKTHPQHRGRKGRVTAVETTETKGRWKVHMELIAKHAPPKQ